MPCGESTLRSGAAWLATRPITAIPNTGQRELLIAAGLGWEPRTGMPRSPTPAATAPPGWWRRGPSTPFAISELPADDLTRHAAFPVPVTSIAPTTTDRTTMLPGHAGDRLFAAITPEREGVQPPPVSLDVLSALSDVRAERDVVVRVPSPPTRGTADDRSSVRLGLAGPQTGAGPATHWTVQVVPINDWGEWGQPVAEVIAQDVAGPAVEVEDPTLSPIWPITARLAGRTEPASTVTVDGLGPVDVDGAGRFTIAQTLAPWPQTLRVTSTDVAGNATVAEFTVIGGVDYRRLPWPGIAAAALLAIVAIRSLVGGRRQRDVGATAVPRSTGVQEDPSMPQIEELPPGSGLARR